MAKYIDVKSITALQSNNNTDVEVVTSSNIIENDDGNGNDFQYNAKVYEALLFHDIINKAAIEIISHNN